MSAAFFQRLFDSMTPRESLPETGYLGDLVKTTDGKTWVYQDGWIELDKAMKLIYPIVGPTKESAAHQPIRRKE